MSIANWSASHHLGYYVQFCIFISLIYSISNYYYGAKHFELKNYKGLSLYIVISCHGARQTQVKTWPTAAAIITGKRHFVLNSNL